MTGLQYFVLVFLIVAAPVSAQPPLETTARFFGPLGSELMTIDAPEVSATVPEDFLIRGLALETRGVVDVVHVWGYQNGPDGVPLPPVFLGWAVPSSPRPPFTSGGFDVFVRRAPLGSLLVVAYARSSVTGTFSNAAAVPVTVRPCHRQIEHLAVMTPNGVRAPLVAQCR